MAEGAWLGAPSEAAFLKDAVPAFAAELVRTLEKEDRADLAEQIANLRLVDRCRCSDSFCATFYTARKPDGSWGPNHETVPLDHAQSGEINVDLVDGRIVAVEVLYRDEIRSVLQRLLP